MELLTFLFCLDSGECQMFTFVERLLIAIILYWPWVLGLSFVTCTYAVWRFTKRYEVKRKPTGRAAE